jgi:RNA polymerase sigma factor for flagellar operon FliA
MMTPNHNPQQAFRNDDYHRFAPLVRRIAIRLGNRIPSHVSVADLVSVGWVGLFEALDRGRDQVPDDEIETFVACRVRGAMLDHLRALDPASRRVRGASRRLSSTVMRLTRQLGQAPAADQVAAAMGLSIEDYHALCGDISNARELSFEDAFDRTLPSKQSPSDGAEQSLMLEKARDAIERLPERLQRLIGLLYEDGMAQCEAAQVLGVGPARVCQLHAEAMKRIRSELGVVA